MDEDDLALRNLTYARFVELGRAPTAAEVAAVGGRGRTVVVRELRLGCIRHLRRPARRRVDRDVVPGLR